MELEPSSSLPASGIPRARIALGTDERVGLGFLVTLAVVVTASTALALLAHVSTSDDLRNRAVALHGAVMAYAVVVPGVLLPFGHLLLPALTGGLTYKRLGRLSLSLYLIGAAALVAAFALGRIRSGWTLDVVVLGSRTFGLVAAAGALLIAFAAAAAGANFLVSVHRLVAPSGSYRSIPVFAWSLAVGGAVQILAAPALAVLVALAAYEHVLGAGVFRPELGGDPVLLQRLFWMYFHPVSAAATLPALGLAVDVVVGAGNPVRARRAIMACFVLLALLGFAGSGSRALDDNAIDATVSSVAGLLSFVASGVVLMSIASELRGGRLGPRAPVLFSIALVTSFGVAAVSGLCLSVPGISQYLAGTVFESAHRHYVAAASVLIGLVVGSLHAWPPGGEARHAAKLAVVSCALVFVGVNAAFLPGLLNGTRGMATAPGTVLRLGLLSVGLAAAAATVLWARRSATARTG